LVGVLVHTVAKILVDEKAPFTSSAQQRKKKTKQTQFVS